MSNTELCKECRKKAKSCHSTQVRKTLYRCWKARLVKKNFIEL